MYMRGVRRSIQNIQYRIKNQTVSKNRTLFVRIYSLVLLLAFAVLTIENTKNEFYDFAFLLLARYT